jgi:dimethylhistidine N-methyltransferase
MNAALPLAQQLPQDVDSQFAQDVQDGLAHPQKTIPCTWLYDHEGSELFEKITRLDAYYPTRSETSLLTRYASELADDLGAGIALIELGAGSLTKTQLVLRALKAPRAYVPIDISADFMLESLARLRAAFPTLNCIPVVGDFTSRDALVNAVALVPKDAPRVAFFPGSTIGNFTRAQARRFLQDLALEMGAGSVLAIGVDATHDSAKLQLAYDDPEGVTAAFNLNMLARINRELEGDFNLSDFVHEARVNHVEERVEMHLVAKREVKVHVLGRSFSFKKGESIHTENSHKYGIDRFEVMAEQCGWSSKRILRGEGHAFEFHVLTREEETA